MDDVLQQALDAAEEAVAAEVADVLAEVADEFAAALADATEIVAARFSVAGIARMWGQRVPRLVRRLLGVAETAAQNTAAAVDAELPDSWDDLPTRYDDDRELPPGMGQYVETTEHLLRTVGDRLADVAVRELAAGVDAGEDIEQLRDRLRDAFAREGAQLGTMREERIARTEAARAWNSATLAAAQELTGPDRPLVKQWIPRHDSDVRSSHAAAAGQLRLLDEPFTIAGIPMAAPGDPTAPPELLINCRCVLAIAHADRTASYESQTPDGLEFTNRRKEPDVPEHVTAVADGSHRTGAMIALMPTPEDAERLAVEGGEEAEELHLTLYFLGEGADWSEAERQELITLVQDRAAHDLEPITARAFGANHWNAGTDTPSWVWAVGDDRDRPTDAPRLESARWVATHALEDRHGPEIPVQHSPWAPHICAAYSDAPALLAQLEERLGPVTFDRIRVAFAGEYTDIPLGPTEAPMEPEETTADGMPTRAWSTPDGTALAFENEETGDGRIFAAGSLYWDTTPAPLQYADEMLMGHEGAELAGSIDSFARDGDRITGKGVLYTSRPAGADAAMLLEEGAPLGVSVDLDDVDVEFVDRTGPEGEEGYALAASLASASLMRLPDGAWLINAATAAEWTASGTALSRAQHAVQLITGPGGVVSADAVRKAFTGTGVLTAAVGDPDDPESGTVVHSEKTGDLLLRITRARLRGATLVAMPAYNRARIVLDPVEAQVSAQSATASADLAHLLAAAPGDIHWKVVAYVSASPIAVGPRQVALALGITMESARGHLTRAVEAGRLVRLSRGLYVGASTIPEGAETTAAAVSTDFEDPALQNLVASAWTAMQDTDPMPAAWFREPTAEELPPGSGGVHYSGGRVYGWVAQAGEPHAGMPGRTLTIDSLGDIDTTHFLRAKFKLDDGSLIRAGAMTMNVGHHRDGAECETASCQFDDTRTVAGIVTVGMSSGGMWFSGAAAPWLSEWDALTFRACQPSYHMKQAPGGKWQLRAVLSVPVPGHSSPLLASVVERSNLALTAAAAGGQGSSDNVSGQGADTADTSSGNVSGQAESAAADLPDQRQDTLSGQAPDKGDIVEAVAALLTSPTFLDRFTGALETREAERTAARDEVERLVAAVAPARQEIAASMAGTVMRGEA
ncbi:phage minor head protein [Streptomyces sp. NPDC057963]|uniref:phage minor head protein n=1 Tax=Streptomyces sp. NPDC057963 TaxID=3346290 RepID=UPI0036E11C6A